MKRLRERNQDTKQVKWSKASELGAMGQVALVEEVDDEDNTHDER